MTEILLIILKLGKVTKELGFKMTVLKDLNSLRPEPKLKGQYIVNDISKCILWLQMVIYLFYSYFIKIC